jgi:hypothetical protein
MFLVIQFDDASNDHLKTFKFARPKHARNSKPETPIQRTRDQPRCHDPPQLIDDECTNLHFAADRSRKSPESELNDTQRPIEAQPDSLRESLRKRSRPRFARTEAKRVTRKTLSALGESVEPRRCRAGSEQDDDFFAPSGAKTPETAKVEPRSSLGSQGSV